MRNAGLVKHRDEQLVRDFFNLYDIKRIRIEDALNELSKKYFLDNTYIYKRIFYKPENRDFYYSLQASS